MGERGWERGKGARGVGSKHGGGARASLAGGEREGGAFERADLLVASEGGMEGQRTDGWKHSIATKTINIG